MSGFHGAKKFTYEGVKNSAASHVKKFAYGKLNISKYII